MASDRIKLGESQTLQVVSSTADVLELESTWAPGGAQPRTHWHPQQDERFEVLEGELTVRLAEAAPHVVAIGETVDVPARTAHSMWNDGNVPCRASWRVTPAQRTEEMFRTIDAGPGMLGRIRMLWTFRHEFRLGSPRA